MSSNVKSAFGSNNQSITCTITSLANSAQRASVAIDNTTNLFLDSLVFVKAKSGASGTATSGTINVYACGTADGGTTYTDNVSSGDATVTLTAPPNAKLIGVINAVANAVIYAGGPFSVAQAFGGILPDHWLIIVENKTGGTLDATTGSVWYQGSYSTVG